MNNKYLTTEEIIQLDKIIDERISTFELLSHEKDQALFYILLYFDQFLDRIARITESDLSARKNIYRYAYNGLNYAVQWIHKYCSSSFLVSPPLSGNEVGELFKNAQEYSNVWSQMSLVFRKRNKCREIKTNVYEFPSGSLRNRDLDQARQSLAIAQDPETQEDTVEVTQKTYQFIQERIILKQIFQNDLAYSISPEAYLSLRKAINERSILNWTMNSEWNLGGYSFGQLKIFWFSLKALCESYNIARNLIDDETTRLALTVRIRDRKKWVTDIKNWSGLSLEIVNQIIDDLTYNQSLYETGKEKPHVMFQPFFVFKDEELALSRGIVQISNIERNAWSLVKLLRRNLHDNLKNLKELFWVQNLSEQISLLGIKVYPNVRYKNGNIDLLLIDEKLKFGLICELKWFTSSDDVAGTDYIDNEILKGVGQAKKSSNWLKTNIEIVSQKININRKILEEIDFKPIVICKDDLPSGFLEKTEVPVINEALFKWVLFAPHHQNLHTLWQVSSSMSYLPKIGVHYQNVSSTIHWGNIEFRLNNVATQLLKRWKPEIDIKF